MVARVLKILCVLFASVTVMLCGCGKNSADQSTVVPDFTADFTGEYRGLSVSGSVVNTRQGVSSVNITAPETLNGLSLHYQNGEIALSRGAVKATADEAYLPQSSLPSVLRELFISINAQDYSRTAGQTYAINGENGEVTVNIDENGFPKTAQGKDFTIEFTNMKSIG